MQMLAAVCQILCFVIAVRGPGSRILMPHKGRVRGSKRVLRSTRMLC